MPRLALLDPTRSGRPAEDLENKLRHLIIGQDEAIYQIVRAYQTHLAGLSPVGRPIGNFLFLGTAGSGKTRIVEATAESLLKNPQAVIKIDCTEFQHSHEIAKLIGSPPGYLGHRETHALLSQQVLNQHHTDNVKLSFDNSRVDFSSSMVFLTSNLGAAEMSSLVSPRLGFHVPSLEDNACNAKLTARLGCTGVEAAHRKFTPEFINRLDKIVVFKSLGNEELRGIVDIELEMVQQRIQTAAASNPLLVMSPKAPRCFC
jgi:ATP-dependent Clp protease ATP-binding subunit ClpB